MSIVVQMLLVFLAFMLLVLVLHLLRRTGNNNSGLLNVSGNRNRIQNNRIYDYSTKPCPKNKFVFA